MKIDITSKAVEKGIDLAKNFLGKLITPSVEELGLLLKENITAWRLKNEIKILLKAKQYCEKHKISPKTISLKLICPLLDNAALEEDEYLQDKWAILLTNLVDSDQNIENHVFPFLLSQISKTEYEVLEKTFLIKQEKTKKHLAELETYRTETIAAKNALTQEIKNFKVIEGDYRSKHEKFHLEDKLKQISRGETKILGKMLVLESISDSDLKQFEFHNLIRLGLVKVTQLNYAYVNSSSIRNDPKAEQLYLDDVEIEVSPEGETYSLSELGELFVKACTEKQ